MATITVPKDVNFKDIENLVKSVHEKPNATLRLPNSLNTSGVFGIEALVLQLFATWLRAEGEHILHTYVQEPENNDSFSDLCNTLYGICALSLSEKIISANKSEINRRFSLLPAVEKIENVRKELFKHAFKGFYLAIPSIKAPGNNNELLSPLYNRGDVVGRSKFFKITKKSLDAVIANKEYELPDQVISNISEILRELFTNTHKHARKDVKGNIIEKNFRSLSFMTATLDRTRLEKISESGGGQLSLFIGEWLAGNKKNISMLDITVVDSGPGYARHWTGLDKDKLNFDKEQEAIVECFKKYKSTDTYESSGSGLSNVLRDLKNLRGWFRLRTGTAQIEKSFFDKKGSTKIEISDIKDKKVFVEGVVFNIIIPLQESKED
mgnify:CR=1 FL=1